jgi:hypothetical protein
VCIVFLQEFNDGCTRFATSAKISQTPETFLVAERITFTENLDTHQVRVPDTVEEIARKKLSQKVHVMNKRWDENTAKAT